MNTRRGVPIGSFTSQPLGNLAVSRIDHHMKEGLRMKCYLRYCDDTVGLARTKAEAKRQLKEYNLMSEAIGLVVKANAFISTIGEEVKRARSRKRMRSRKRQKN